MENKLKTLFGFQRFEENASLQKVIDSTHARYVVRELSLDQMGKVAAAGIPQQPERKREEPDRG